MRLSWKSFPINVRLVALRSNPVFYHFFLNEDIMEMQIPQPLPTVRSSNLQTSQWARIAYLISQPAWLSNDGSLGWVFKNSTSNRYWFCLKFWVVVTHPRGDRWSRALLSALCCPTLPRGGGWVTASRSLASHHFSVISPKRTGRGLSTYVSTLRFSFRSSNSWEITSVISWNERAQI